MFCNIAQRSYSEFSTSLGAAAINGRMPYVGAFELTYRCNQACCHCYCNLNVNDRRKADELTTPEVKRILDEISDAGCLWLLLTGGEILVREDFPEIYLHALRRGMIAEVFTNGTLIDDTTARLLADYPPLGVDISIYGSTPALHDKITGVKGSFAKTMDGLERLRKHNIRFSLKTIIMTLNCDDLKRMQGLAETLGSRFHFDTLISPRTDGGMGPAGYRIDTDRMVAFDLDEEKDFKDIETVFDNFWKKGSKEIFNCGAGVFAFNINPYGSLSPCTMFSSFQYDLRTARFSDAWKKTVAECRTRQNELIPDECKSCDLLAICSRCAAWAETETKSLSKKVDYLCEYAKSLEKRYFEKKRRMENEEKVCKAGDQRS